MKNMLRLMSPAVAVTALAAGAFMTTMLALPASAAAAPAVVDPMCVVEYPLTSATELSHGGVPEAPLGCVAVAP
ncbi:hypothetical protein DPM19_30940 [Actinomadura craniellae]|uniref:Secreted protein n=1 Tax=Actinomadura craniellae TaxID=2231787 RepID=A0A365GX75_9ACTN|nr:hypothetical protein [Actinomadura craniellae]RAY11435.1 hypothetical protein DPM19_30940 [Actinomadura craniellae]